MSGMKQVRLATYSTGALGVVGLLVAGLGYAEFDHATGVIDFAPFNLYALAALAPTVVSPFLAAIAVIRGWGAK